MSVTVRDAALDALRDERLTTMFSNPGSTEVPFLVGLPEDFRFVLGLHEGSVVGIATGHAIASGEPALVLLHTTAGLGNAVGALATARVNRAPLVVIVGQQDRRHLALEPFLAGRLEGLAGDYPVATLAPERAADVPSAIRRAAQLARSARGPALLIVPMDDWEAPAEPDAAAAPRRAAFGRRRAPDELAGVAAALRAASGPAIVAGAGNDRTEGWAALVALAETLGAPVWQEAFSARAGFPQDHPLFVGHLPADRPRIRQALAGRDVVLVIGAAAFRQYPYADGSLVPDGTALYVISDDPDEVVRSPATLAIQADPVLALEELRTLVGEVDRSVAPIPAHRAERYRLPVPRADEPLRPAHVFQLLAATMPSDTVFLEESPSSRQVMESLLPARHPLGFVSAAMGGLGFAMPAAIGMRMALPDRPVVAVIGDGSSMYSIQSLWTAAREGVGVVFLVLANGGYAVMDRLAESRGGAAVWPGFLELSIAALAADLGVTVERVTDHAALEDLLRREAPELPHRRMPLLVEIAVGPDADFTP